MTACYWKLEFGQESLAFLLIARPYKFSCLIFQIDSYILYLSNMWTEWTDALHHPQIFVPVSAAHKDSGDNRPSNCFTHNVPTLCLSVCLCFYVCVCVHVIMRLDSCRHEFPVSDIKMREDQWIILTVLCLLYITEDFKEPLFHMEPQLRALIQNGDWGAKTGSTDTCGNFLNPPEDVQRDF